jgi:phosphatidylserine/phosphatidylglycerophosphate/cardiolipin synthase-like enzyme
MARARSLALYALAFVVAAGGLSCRTPDRGQPGPAPASPAPAGAVAHAPRIIVPSERVEFRAYFNEPGPENGYVDHTLRDQLVTYIAGAVPGSEIRAHVTQLSGAPSMRVVPDALIAAHERGVTIQMVHDGNSFVFPELLERLGDDYVHCGTPEVANNTGCLSRVADGTHHMKSWYFSHVVLGDTSYRHVVITSSYNITVTQARQFNDMLVVKGDQALYDAYVERFEDYRQQHKTDDRYTEPAGSLFVPSAGLYGASFSPQKRGDMVADALRRIDAYEEGCSLGVANLNLTRSAIIRQLLRVRQLGCEVLVVTGTPLTAANEERLRAGGIETRHVAIEHDGRLVSLHNKMMVYRGHYAHRLEDRPANDQRVVWTGSQNFTARPLRFRDDVFVSISHPPVYDAYRAHFETIWAAASANVETATGVEDR